MLVDAELSALNPAYTEPMVVPAVWIGGCCRKLARDAWTVLCKVEENTLVLVDSMGGKEVMVCQYWDRVPGMRGIYWRHSETVWCFSLNLRHLLFGLYVTK